MASMNLRETVKLGEKADAGYTANIHLTETIALPRASAHIVHRRPKGDGTFEVLSEETVHNVITTVGRDFLHTQGYGIAPAGNGLNYIALSNDTLTETSASTTLSNEIAANGLTRAIGVVAHTVATNTTTVILTFTCATAPQAAQKAALFTAVAAGTMNHVLAFTQRSLQIADQLVVTFTITIG